MHDEERNLMEEVLLGGRRNVCSNRLPSAALSAFTGGAASSRYSTTGIPSMGISASNSRLQKAKESVEAKKRELSEELRHSKILKDRLLSHGISEECLLDYQEEMCENLNLRRRVHDMEKFLADYNIPSPYNAEVPSNGTGLQMMSVEHLKACIQNLNELLLLGVAGESIQTSSERVTLTLWANGIEIDSSQHSQRKCLRAYDDPSTQSFLQDIADGFFPSEFQKAYPDGVIIDVCDHGQENNCYPNERSSRSEQAFGGAGYRLHDGASIPG
jgi:hypothetical protein